MTVPRQGLRCIVLGVSSNGIERQAAIITRAWADTDTAAGPVCVNLTVFPDCDSPRTHGSVMLYETESLAVAARAAQPGMPVAFWLTKAGDEAKSIDNW